MDGKVHTYKARLNAKGYTQTHGIDYEETFSPVAKIKSIRIMLAIAAFHDYEIWQMDVKTAFLNGKLTEDVFMAQPEGFENAKYPKRVCKLQKAIYGLKQASRSWNLCFHEKVTQFGFSRSEDESCIYVKISGSIVVFLVLYVDDILLIGNDIPTLQSVKDCFLVYGGEKELRVTGYCDASWQIDKDDSRSQSGWVFLLNREAVTWKSLKQDTNFIGNLGVVPTVQDPIEIFCDNESAVALTKEPKDHGKSKHIERKYHFVRSKVEEGHVIVKDTRSEDNPDDPFTKALAKSRHDEHARSIGLKDKIKF
ncbi:retrovirus-related pol polyprotein from transposon TNT 1-94 [Tanacetum coccineum]